MSEQIAFADYTSLVVVTDEMRKLRVCPECAGRGGLYDPLCGAFCKPCPTCKGTGLNPDQSKWWEALALSDPNGVGEFSRYNSLGDSIILMKDFPEDTKIHLTGKFPLWGKNDIHRPSGDNRPWPKVLRDMIYTEICRGGKHEHNSSYLEGDPFDVVVPISFALATPETAPVFKGFGIETIGRL